MWKKVSNYLLNNMEFNRILLALTSLFRIVIRISTFPIIIIDSLLERVRLSTITNFNKPKEPSEKQIRSQTIASVIDSIVSNKSNVISNNTINRIKLWAIVLLEFTSLITTAIGMTIVASDISPAIALIWAFVIQSLAGSLSGYRGKWNNILLAFCIIFSVASDYVCYVNTVSPYDVYIETQYTAFKTSYDRAWERAMGLIGEYELTTETIDIAFNTVSRTITSLEQTHNEAVLVDLNAKLERLIIQRDSLSATVNNIVTYNVTIDPNTGQQIRTPVYGTTPNPEYTRLNDEIEQLNANIEMNRRIILITNEIKQDFNNMKTNEETDINSRVKELILAIQNPENSDKTLQNEELSVLSVQFTDIQNRINSLIKNEQIGMSEIIVYNLSSMMSGNANYNALVNLELQSFTAIRLDVGKNNNSIFDRLFSGFATIIDSDFAINATDLKKTAEQLTYEKYDLFMKETASLALEDAELNSLIYGPNNLDSTIPLTTAFGEVEYRDAMSKAFDYLINPGNKVIETYSRVVYALLADGLVLLIGLSMRRKRKKIFNNKNNLKLTNEEPRLIGEALYNLAARPLEGDETTVYKIDTLLVHLNEFMSYFTPEPFLRDDNLKVNFSMVCNDHDSIHLLNTNFKEFICLLQTLGYIKPISVEQYNLFRNFKLNKASLGSNYTSNDLPSLSGNDNEFYYLMTEGFALYLFEKINDLHQHIENDNYKKEIIKGLNKEE